MNELCIPTRRAARGFSLVEVLMAIFILGIGVISIAALFPAGIVQQRKSVDDVIGPIVANNAIAVLRSKVRSEDFGTFEEFSSSSPIVTIDGDWSWLRPGFIFGGGAYPNGAIDIFGGAGATAFEPTAINGIPYNSFVYGGAPGFIVTQEERYYPMAPPAGATLIKSKPQYVWDCMFRRFQGRIQVAIFVYRVSAPGGEGTAYAVAENPSASDVPPIPIHLDLGGAGTMWDANTDRIPGAACSDYDPFDQAQAWQESGQWILDQNNNVHRVLSSYCDGDDRIAELVRPVPAMPPLPVFSTLGTGEFDIVTNIHYVPITDLNGNRLTPVYAAVKEL